MTKAHSHGTAVVVSHVTSPICWTCGGTPNPSNFGGLCDHCDDSRRQRLARSASFLRDNGMENTQECRALTALGY